MKDKKNTVKPLILVGIVLILLMSMLFVGQSSQNRGVDKTLVSGFATEVPVVDGSGSDTAWAAAEEITTSNGVTLKSVHTASTVYFLATWSDSTRSVEKNLYTFAGGEWSKSGNEDRIAFAWNIGGSVAGFDTDGCMVACHAPAMSTGADGEKIDAWHWKAARTDPVGYADDKYWDNADTTDDHEASRHGDAKDSGGYSDNKQDLNNSVDIISVPKYYEPDATGDDAKFITAKEITDGEAKLITGVDINGTLSYTGGVVPTDAEIPGYYLEKAVGSRGDISVASSYSGGKWTVEISRALDTGHDDDIKFSATSGAVYFFGVAVFDNVGGMSHVTSNNNVYKLMFVKDSDGDGVEDSLDAFPEDPAESVDTDADGVGDNGDAFPSDANETADSDSDGVGNNADTFPNDATETADTDTDGVGNNADAFPNDIAASVDADDDDYPDEWNTGKTETDSTSGLKLDEFPDDATKWTTTDDKKSDGDDDDGDDNTMMILVIVIVVVVVILALVMMMKKKKD